MRVRAELTEASSTSEQNNRREGATDVVVVCTPRCLTRTGNGARNIELGSPDYARKQLKEIDNAKIVWMEDMCNCARERMGGNKAVQNGQ
mmetsp:Transcript_5681/g.8030  ORF Transcript_5681/g.8030 Transcript_5681/m.8030 type:complete len:90 (+) Transcript_5681:137-406(+)